MSVVQKLCPLCSFEAPTVGTVLNHLRTVHSNDPRFQVACGIDGGATTSKSFSALYSHIYRRHPDMIKKQRESLQIVSCHATDNNESAICAAPSTSEVVG